MKPLPELKQIALMAVPASLRPRSYLDKKKRSREKLAFKNTFSPSQVLSLLDGMEAARKLLAAHDKSNNVARCGALDCLDCETKEWLFKWGTK